MSAPKAISTNSFFMLRIQYLKKKKEISLTFAVSKDYSQSYTIPSNQLLIIIVLPHICPTKKSSHKYAHPSPPYSLTVSSSLSLLLLTDQPLCIPYATKIFCKKAALVALELTSWRWIQKHYPLGSS